MNRLSLALGNAVFQLEREKLRFALIGGLAVSARTEPRFTRDAVDIKSLLEAADAKEPTRARKAVKLITARGFQRGRDLVASQESAIKQAQPV